MNWILLATVLAIAFSYGDFIRHPEKYGEIMRRFDQARYNVDPNFYVGPVD